MTDRLAAIPHPKTRRPQRRLTPEEDRFIANERLLTKIDWRYWAERYCYINAGATGLQRLYPLWEPQTIVLERLGKLQDDRIASGHPDGLLINVLKSRQEGISTLGAALITHRVVTHSHVRTLLASDVPDNSGSEGLFGMYERIVANLPWWLRPTEQFHAKNQHIIFDNGSAILVESGKSMKGGLQDKGGTKGQLGRSKSQPLTAGILTPTGWTTMGALTVGDLVVGKNGYPTPVTGIYPQGAQPTYRITCSDGATTECSADHLWTVEWRDRSDDPPRQVTCHTTDLIAAGLYGHKGILRFRLPRPEPIAFFAQPVPLDPYLVGALIGDGTLSAGRVGFTSDDPQLAERIGSRLPDAHRITATKGPRTTTYFIVAAVLGRPNRVARAVRHLGLSRSKAATKHVPSVYLYATAADRVRLLQGLMDTDGWVGADGRLGYGTVSPQLAKDICFLVRSLGGTAKPSRHKPWYTYKGERREGQLAYRLAIVLPPEIIPFWLARKIDKYCDKPTRPPHRTIVAIEYVGVRESQCIRVGASDHLYVTDDCVVTHNTFSAVHLTELSTWETPEQIDDSLMPAVPRTSRTLGIKESTAKGRHNWHHEDWLQGARGRGRWLNIFIPWYALAHNRLPAPLDWVPNETTTAHAARAAQDGPKWLGRAVDLDREQLFWYEETRAVYAEKGQLAKVLEEYAADPEECFQHTGRSIFTIDQLQYLTRLAHPPVAVWTVAPAKDLAEIRQADLARIATEKAEAAVAAEARRRQPRDVFPAHELPDGLVVR